MTTAQRILALDGGGTGGFGTAEFLCEFEHQTKRFCRDMFALFAGTSTGSILAVGLASGRTALELYNLYSTLIPKVFRYRGWWHEKTAGLLAKSKYEIHDLRDVLLEEFDTLKFGDIGRSVMINSSQITEPAGPVFWKSWDEEDKDTLVVDALCASCAAPFFFRPYRIGDEYFVDGAFSTNNPSMCALMELLRVDGALNDPFLLNIRCGVSKAIDLKTAANMGSLRSWGEPLVGTLIKMSDRLAEYQAHQMIGFANHVVDLGLYDLPVDAWDRHGSTAVQNFMETQAQKAWNQHANAILDRFPPMLDCGCEPTPAQVVQMKAERLSKQAGDQLVDATIKKVLAEQQAKLDATPRGTEATDCEGCD